MELFQLHKLYSAKYYGKMTNNSEYIKIWRVSAKALSQHSLRVTEEKQTSIIVR
jgi:hypothetical protein